MADDDYKTTYRSSPPSHWNHFPNHPHSHHGTPAQEYAGFSFTSPHMPMEPSAFATGMQHRPMHQQLQPLVMPQWPSMLNSQAPSTFQPMYNHQPVQPSTPAPMLQLHTPVSATSTRSASTPRKTLTDMDRKRMCEYAEEHPNSKQTEIGAIFGVERSTVSKVLRQKDKYLCQDDGSRSPGKRAKSRAPDIERTLAVWAKNQEKKGKTLTDDLIRGQARVFVATTPSPDSYNTISTSWLEKFKLKHNLMGARTSKASLAPDDAENPAAAPSSSSQTPGDNSPISPSGFGSPSPVELHSVQSHESLKHESPDGYIDFNNGRQGPFHSQSANSLNSASTDAAAPSSFSTGAPLSPSSPFFTPDSGTAPSPFLPQHSTTQPTHPASSNDNSQRPRSQTFPLLDQYMTSSGEGMTPKYSNATLDSPMEETVNSLVDFNAAMESGNRHSTVIPSEMMRPPPLPGASNISGLQTTTPQEARRALQVVLAFFEQQPEGFLNLNESMTMGRLMEKLKLQENGGSS